MSRHTDNLCALVERYLDRWIDGDLAAEHRAGVAAHVETCEACRKLVLSAEAARDGLRALPRLQPTEELRARIARAVAESGAPRGLEVLRRLPRLTPSPESRARIAAAVAPLVARRQERLCRRFAREVDALLDGELPEWLALALEGHLRRCERCTTTYRAAGVARARLAGLERRPLRGSLRTTLADVPRARRVPSRTAWVPVAAGAALLLLVVGTGVVRRWLPQAGPLEPPTIVAGVGDGGVTPSPESTAPRAPEASPATRQARAPEVAPEAAQYVSRPIRTKPSSGVARRAPGDRGSTEKKTTPSGPPDTLERGRTSEPVVVIAGASPVSVSVPVGSSTPPRNASTIGRAGDGPLSL